MAYRGYDNRPGDNRWRDRATRGDRDYGRFESRGGYDDDRGFFDRAGDEVRSWFGDDEASRRREADERRWERERASGRSDYGYRGNYDTGGFGNQRGWERGGRFASESDAPGGYGSAGSSYADSWSNNAGGYSTGAGGFGGTDDGQRFDRVNVGGTGTHAAHPVSAPVGGSSYDRPRYGDRFREESGGGAYGGRDLHDRHYGQWRQQRIDELDRDYDDYRRENQSRFESEFGGWREKRQGQRSLLGRVTEHMEVIGSDGEHIGTVDKVRGDRIILTKNDQDAGGRHHSIPCSWVETVEDKVTVSRTADQAQTEWRDEERNRALFESENQGSSGPHVLGRSFSGTY